MRIPNADIPDRLPTVGRIVLWRSTLNGPAVLPAIVVCVNSSDDSPAHALSLVAFVDNGIHPVLVTEYGDEHGCWDWPEIKIPRACSCAPR